MLVFHASSSSSLTHSIQLELSVFEMFVTLIWTRFAPLKF